MARHDQVVAFVGASESYRIAHPKVDLQVCLFGLAAGSINHLLSEIDSGHGVAELREPKG